MTKDPRQSASRYRLNKLQHELEAEGLAEPVTEPSDDGGTAPSPTSGSTATDRAAYIETAIQQAMRRGEFDNLPGAGKPIEGLGASHDPNWWIRQKIASENVTGLGPPALTLRIEHIEFHERLDALASGVSVREYVEDFNARVVAARRQLEGGPPVVTPTRDVDAEVDGWRERRASRFARDTETAIPEVARRAWWRVWRRG